MPVLTTADGTDIFFKDWGSGQPIVFSHGWPLSADDWDTQMLFFLQHGYRVIAHDRRGHGRSTPDQRTATTWTITRTISPRSSPNTSICTTRSTSGHSTGGGEVAHYLARHGEQPGREGGAHQLRAAA